MSYNDWMGEMKEGSWAMKGMGWRIAFSAVSLLLWFTFMIAWLFFMADDYTIYQNIGSLLGSLVLVVLVNIPVWVSFTSSWEGLVFDQHHHGIWRGVAGLIWVVGIALWLFQYAGDFSIYQNTAVLILSLVPLAAIKMVLKR